MKQTTLLLASAGLASALTQQCTGTAADEGGNWFCGAVGHILYQGVGGKGSYKAVTNMSPTGECTKQDKAFGGPLAPLDEDLSIHIRGPIHLKEAAVYNLSNDNKWKREIALAQKKARAHHGHHQLHKAMKEKRAEWITATINGDVVSWEKIGNYGPKTDAPPATAAPTGAPNANANAAAAASPASSGGDSANFNIKMPSGPSGQDWDRVAYYNAENQTVENMVFMGNYGGQYSGVWDNIWGSSLAYLNSDASGGAASPQTLKDAYIPSNKEFAIFSGEKCGNECGYSRAADVAYKGFAGGHKVFLFNFKMPLDGNRGFNGDMPAIWALNSAIPRAAQYNGCSCWDTGCGEVDMFEVLAKGDTKCKSTFHLANGAGSSDYFDRPTDKYMKAAVVFDEDASAVSIRVLPDDTDFSKGLDDETVANWVTASGSKQGGPKLLSSLFQVAGGLL